MRFSKYYQPNNRCGGRKPSAATIAKREAEYQQQREKEKQMENEAFENFKNAEEGRFNGFEMSEIFHHHYDKSKAIYIGESDDCSDVETPFGKFHTGADGVMAYFFNEHPTKRVDFNRSVYFI